MEDSFMRKVGNGLATLAPANIGRPLAREVKALQTAAEPERGRVLSLVKWAPPKRQSLVDTIVADIVERIAAGELRDGDCLPCQRDLARTLGVSRTPLREALNKLAGMGLVELRQGRGTFIRIDGMPNLAR